jgi:hypothetical protein
MQGGEVMTLTPTDIQCMAAGYPAPAPGYEWVFGPQWFEPWQRRKDMAERNELVGALAEALHRAARASVAKGAQYRPGEQIDMDVETAWRGVAEGLVNLIEKVVAERQGRTDVRRS